MNPIKENIIDELGFEGLSNEEKETRMANIGALIYQNVLMRVMETMSDEDQDEFEKLLDHNAQPGEIFTFFKSKVENFEMIISEEAKKFKNNTENIMNQIGD